MEPVDLTEFPKAVPLDKVDEVVHADGAYETNRRSDAERDAACGDRRFVRRLFMRKLHGIEKILSRLDVRPIRRIVLRAFKQRTEVKYRLHVRAVHVLFHDFAAKFNAVNAQEDITGHRFSLPSLRLQINVLRDIGIDVRENILERFHLGTADVLLAEHLIDDIMLFHGVEIPQGKAGKTAPGKVFGNGGTDGPAPYDMDAGLILLGLEVFIRCA